MLVYDFLYSDGQVIRRSFLDEGEALWFALNEGDHLISYTRIC